MRHGPVPRSHRGYLSRLVAVLTVTAAAIAGVTVPTAPAVAVVTSYAMIGDSITWQATANLEAAIPGIRVDGVIGRTFSQVNDAFDSMIGQGSPDVLIIALGTNPPMTQSQVDAFMERAGAIEAVFFVNIRIPRDWEASTNDLIDGLGQQYANVTVIDWFGFSSTRPEVFNSSGFHLSDEGKPVYANFIAASVFEGSGPCDPPTQTEEGSAGVGVVDPASGVWYLRDPLTGLTTSFYYGNPGDVPMMGDWDGDGVDSPGLYRRSDGYVYLRNLNTQGNADIAFLFGNPGDLPVPGDFDGDGSDTVSLYRPSEQRFYIINSLGSGGEGLGAADFDLSFGQPGDQPFAGDFDGDGSDTVGTYGPTTGLVSLHSFPGSTFLYGSPGDQVLLASFEGDSVETIGLYRESSSVFFLRSSNTTGNATHTFRYGRQGFSPIAGLFGELSGLSDPPSPLGCDYR